MLTNREFNSLSPNQQQKLSNLLNYITHDDPCISKAKRLLVAGITPEKVSMLLQIPLEKVEKLHSEGWNPRCRQQAKPRQAELAVILQQRFHDGCDLKTLCHEYDLPLISVIQSLLKGGYKDIELTSRFPVSSDPLVVEYHKTLRRHAKQPWQRANHS